MMDVVARLRHFLAALWSAVSAPSLAQRRIEAVDDHGIVERRPLRFGTRRRQLDYSPAERAKVIQYLLGYSGEMHANLRARALEFQALAETSPGNVERLEQFYRAIYTEGNAEDKGFQWFVRYVQGIRERVTGRDDRPIARAWRPMLCEVVRCFVQKDYRLARGVPGVEAVSDATAERMRNFLSDCGATLVELPDETWQTSGALWTGTHWYVWVHLWTAETGRSDLGLWGHMVETSTGPRFTVKSVYRKGWYSPEMRAKVAQSFVGYSGEMYANLRKRAMQFQALFAADPVDVARLEQFVRAMSAERESEGSAFNWFASYVRGLGEHLTGRDNWFTSPGRAPTTARKGDFSPAERAYVMQKYLKYCDGILAELGEDYGNFRKRVLEFRGLAEADPVDVERLEQFYRAIRAECKTEGSGFRSFVAYVWALRRHLTGRNNRYPNWDG